VLVLTDAAIFTPQQRADANSAKALLSSEIIELYHGTKETNLVPVFGRGRLNNDFGQGFYTTSIQDLAREWSYSQYSVGDEHFVYKYYLNLEGLTVLDFTQIDIFYWLALLLRFRELNENALTEVGTVAVSIIKTRYELDLQRYDVVVGYRADDGFFNFAADFVNGGLSLNSLEQLLHSGGLGLQCLIRSGEAYSQLEHRGEKELVDARFEQRYSDRLQHANSLYDTLKSAQRSISGKYITDFLREWESEGAL
jgi:hypothetical protein